MQPYISSPYLYYYNYYYGNGFMTPAMPADFYNSSYMPIADLQNPTPILTNNPPVTAVTLFKELSGYPNYGNPSGNADILYTGNRGEWTFEVSPLLIIAGSMNAQLYIRAVLDDHQTVPVNRYSTTITINGTVVHRGQLPLQHGIPTGGMFTNWSTLVFNVSPIRRTNTIVITNTSTTGPNDWIAFDWMEMRFAQRR